MFDRLIVSEPAGAGARSRRNYFLISTLAVGTLVLTAVVASIFAEEIGLGADSIELSILVMPVDPPATQPEPPRPKDPTPQRAASSSDLVPTRQANMSRVDEPTIIPKATSTAANTQMSRPDGRFTISNHDSDTSMATGVERDPGNSGPNDSGLQVTPEVAHNVPDSDPPPRHVDPPKNSPPKSLGVINGIAKNLPKPAYPAAALAINAQGKVDVQVLIDEQGRVVSAKAVDGHPLLRLAAENAARNARFSPTLLSNVPVKVTGVIVYTFTRG